MEDVNFIGIDRSILLDIARMEMPYGKYKGWKLKSLTEPYLVWMKGQGFPKGRLGMLLSTLYEIKLNGLEFLLKNL